MQRPVLFVYALWFYASDYGIITAKGFCLEQF